MNGYDPRSLNSVFTTNPARLGNLDSAVAMSMAFVGPMNLGAVSIVAQRAEFIASATACGLTREQAIRILDVETRRARVTGLTAMARADARRMQFLGDGYLTMPLYEVLTDEELAQQPFSDETILNGRRWMKYREAKAFNEMDDDRRRVLVQAAIELSTQLGGAEEGWLLERAVNTVMPYQEGR